MIGLKRSKDEAVDEVENSAYTGAMQSYMQQTGGYGGMGTTHETISRMMAMAIRYGLEELFNQMYKSEDFEKDMGLNEAKEKPR